MNRKVLNSSELDELMKEKNKATYDEGTRLSKKFKNSLDSDEEDDEKRAEKYNIFNPEDFEGQEEATIEQDGEIKITPFNMKEELEEGYFDKDGTYIFQKEEDVIRDQWLDDIDWVKVKSGNIPQQTRRTEESDSDDLPELDVVSHYKKMLGIMKSDETVQKAICRLGSSSKGSRNSKRCSKDQEMSEEEKEQQQKNKEMLQELTSLASELLQNGNTDIYQQTFEKLTFLVKAAEQPRESIYDTSSAADMFGDTYEEIPTNADDRANQNVSGNANSESEVMWEFKWESKEDSPVYGPHATSEMLNWVQEGYFEAGVFVRQAGKTDSEFYSSKRMDFELYL